MNRRYHCLYSAVCWVTCAFVLYCFLFLDQLFIIITWSTNHQQPQTRKSIFTSDEMTTAAVTFQPEKRREHDHKDLRWPEWQTNRHQEENTFCSDGTSWIIQTWTRNNFTGPISRRQKPPDWLMFPSVSALWGKKKLSGHFRMQLNMKWWNWTSYLDKEIRDQTGQQTKTPPSDPGITGCCWKQSIKGVTVD